MSDPIESRVNKWDQNGDERFREINRKIIHLDEWLFSDYEPLIGTGPSFWKRLSSWLDNVDDEEDQKLLFQLVPHIFYIGREELNVLYREAYHRVFAQWLIDQVTTDISSKTILHDLNTAVSETWFCPLTDSLRINQFYHINDIPGKQDHRPDFRSLRTFGDIQLIKKHIEKTGIKRIVLLEDFIGNGGQVSKAVNFAADNLKEVPVLIIPLIICPAGMEQAEKFSALHSNIKIAPVISVPHDYFVHEIETDIELEFFKKVHTLAEKTYSQVSNSDIIDDDIDPYGPFGWRRTGGLIVMHTNTPNNTLPMLHNKSETWEPLFKRHKRI
jgi:hypothetical protein